MPDDTKAPIVPKLPVFISWSGAQADLVAKGFRQFLPDILNGIEPFLSESDIAKGARWRDVLTTRLHTSSCAIVCLTKDSLESTWVAFEIGAISRAAGGPDEAHSQIWTYLFGLDTGDIQLSPYSQYQGTTSTEADTFTLIRNINERSSDLIPPESLRRRFTNLFWPEFSKILDQANQAPQGKSQPPKPTEREILSEILVTVRSIQQTQQPILRASEAAYKSSMESLIAQALAMQRSTAAKETLPTFDQIRIRLGELDERTPDATKAIENLATLIFGTGTLTRPDDRTLVFAPNNLEGVSKSMMDAFRTRATIMGASSVRAVDSSF